MTSVDNARDHLFISYATEDSALADWLALKLTVEGYKVWYDRKKLLGGESYPRDIDEAIKNRSFRLIALLSHSSLVKPNPSKERTLALSISRDRHIDFLIPLNVSFLKPTELDWMTSDLTFIDFGNWADGFTVLLKKLESIEAPRNQATGWASIFQWFDAAARPQLRQEKLWSNVLPLKEIPIGVNQYEVSEVGRLHNASTQWPFYKQSESLVWAFAPPPIQLNLGTELKTSIEWQKNPIYSGLDLRNVVSNLIYRSLISHCLSKGLTQTRDNRKVYFPDGLLPNDQIHFVNYTGKKSYIRVAGIRTFYKTGMRDLVRYHLSPSFMIKLRGFEIPCVIISISLVLTELNHTPLDAKKAVSRRKKLCKNWWNHQWLSRMFALNWWLSNGSAELVLCRTDQATLSISSIPLSVIVEHGIDEAPLGSIGSTISDDDIGDMLANGIEEEAEAINEDETDE